MIKTRLENSDFIFWRLDAKQWKREMKYKLRKIRNLQYVPVLTKLVSCWHFFFLHVINERIDKKFIYIKRFTFYYMYLQLS